jgi:hypothetical protein
VNNDIIISSDSTSIHGADISAAKIYTDSTIGGRFLESNGWEVARGKLPRLFNETVVMPDYLIPKFEDATIELDEYDTTYSGTQKKPDVTVTIDGATFNSGTEYTVSYVNNKDVGTGSVTVTGINDFKNKTKTKNFTITPKPLTITAHDTTISYGSAVPIYRLSYAGFADGENRSTSDLYDTRVTCAYTNVSDTGTYPNYSERIISRQLYNNVRTGCVESDASGGRDGRHSYSCK